MEYIILVLSIIAILVLYYVSDINIKKLKELANKPNLNELVKRFPENTEIAREILKKLNNESVKVEENKEGTASLYIVQTNKIIISNAKENYMQTQTIAHECLHSVQSKKMQWFNFIFTNVYLLYTATIIILTVTKVIKEPAMFLTILVILSAIHYFIRSILESEAMYKAKYLAKEYIEENQLCTKEQLKELVDQYEKMNQMGIKMVNFEIFFKDIIKVIIYTLVCVIV